MFSFIKNLLKSYQLSDLASERVAVIQQYDAREIDSRQMHAKLSDIETRKRALESNI